MKKFTYLLIVIGCLLITNLKAQDAWQWAKTAGIGTVGENGSHDITTDKDGNVYLVGRFKEAVFTIGGIALANTQSLTNDIFFAKYDKDGVIIWAKSFGGTKDDHAYSISVDNNQNVFLVGNFSSSSMTIGTITLINNQVDKADVFISKFDINGDVLWAISTGGIGNDYGRESTIDKDGNLLVCGDYESSTLNFGTTTLSNTNADYNLYLVKLDNATGNEIWAKTTGEAGGIQVADVETDSQGNVYLAGGFSSSSLTFAGSTLNNPENNLDILMLKYDNNGNEVWAKSVSTNTINEASAIAVDHNDNVYFGGYFVDFMPLTFNTASFTNTGAGTAFLVKYNSAGIEQWAKSFGGNGSTYIDHISINNENQLYITGEYDDTDIAFGAQTITNSNAGKHDIFLTKYNDSGTNLWAQTIGGVESDVSGASSSNECGELYITGQFDSADMTFGTNRISNVSSPQSQMYFAKFAYEIQIVGTVTDATTGNNGAIDITITNGTAPYDSILWQPNLEQTEDIANLDSGKYTVTVIDAKGCKQSKQFEVEIDFVCENKQANNWYFGQKAGITFNTVDGEPVALTNGEIQTFEGTSTINDNNGKLLFYTNGVVIWDSTHQVMSNGLGLNGHVSSTQSALIVKKPDSKTIYYVFTADNRTGADGFQYSIVDMSLNGGKGSVTLKNQLLISAISNTVERCSATLHSDGSSVWVVSQKYNTNEFHAFLLDKTGINTVPVISSIGFQTNTSLKCTGQMRFSASGTQIANVMYDTITGVIETFDFNKTTGKVSNVLHFGNNFPKIYGVEFSPSGQYLYTSSYEENLSQFDMFAGKTSDIINSKKVIATNLKIASLHLGPNGRIYCAITGKSYISVINSPEKKGILCDFVEEAVDLGTGVANSGLNNLSSSFFTKAAYNFKNFCINDSTKFTSNANGSDIQTIDWNFDDTQNNISTDSNPSHLFSDTGNYNVKMNITSACYNNYTVEKEVRINPLPTFNLGKDTSFCQADSLELNVATFNATYLWKDGSKDSIFLAKLDENSWVEVTDTNTKCVKSDTINISYSFILPIINLGKDTILCENDTIKLDAKVGFTYQWHNDSIQQTFSADTAGTFWVKITSNCGEKTDSITVIYNDSPIVNLGKDTILCFGDSLKLDISNSKVDYLWQDSSSASMFIVAQQGIYSLVVTDSNGCKSLKDSIQIQVDKEAILNITDTLFEIEKGEIVEINTGIGEESQINWTPQQGVEIILHTAANLSPESSTVYTIYTTTKNGCTDTGRIEITIFKNLEIVTAFSPNGDNVNDTWEIIGIEKYPDASVKILNRWGNTLYEVESNYYGNEWTGEAAPVASYFYFIDLKDGSEVINGTITIIK